jgi:GTP-binding protein
MPATVAIVGRPNVGKSTLFNKLIGERKALVHDQPGVTRDRIYASCRWEGREIALIDTGGFEPDPHTDLFGAMRTQVRVALEEAHVLLFVVDRKTGLHPVDELVADVLRSTQKPVLLVVNKVDEALHENETAEFYKLSPARIFPVSAEHGRGISALMEAVVAELPPPDPSEESDEGDLDDEEDHDALPWDEPGEGDEGGEGDEAELFQEQETPTEIRVAILGRPNVGKSTLANRLLGEDRHLVHDAPGTTVDAIDSTLEYEGRTFRLVDTAGIRRRSRIDDRLEVLAVSRALRTIERCHVTVFVLDGTQSPSTQDARLASLAAEKGRALIFLVNRWDLVRKETERDARLVEEEIRRAFPMLSWAPILFISALTGKGCTRILPLVERVYAQFDKRVPTAQLNEFLREIEARNPPPQRCHHPVRIHFGTQARVRPPTFVFFSNTPEAIRVPYRRFIENQLRASFGFDGTPIRLAIRRKRKPGAPKA